MIVLNGGDNPLQEEQVKAFQQLTSALANKWTPEEVNAIPRHQDLAIGIAAWLAEAPAGYRIRDRRLPFPESTTTDAELSHSVTNEKCPDIPHRAAPAGIGDERAPCSVSDDQGVRYLKCNARATIMHDAPSPHCQIVQSSNIGPSFNCMGKCGPNCTPTGRGYTRDCADHDICAGHHGINTWEAPCGDEWDEAVDDFLLSLNQCGGKSSGLKDANQPDVANQTARQHDIYIPRK